MKIKTSELTGWQLDWAVAVAGPTKHGSPVVRPHNNSDGATVYRHEGMRQIGVDFRPSTNWADGGPIIERERIACEWSQLWGCWQATDLRDARFLFPGETPLVAAMRCYVASKLGDVIEIPEGLS